MIYKEHMVAKANRVLIFLTESFMTSRERVGLYIKDVLNGRTKIPVGEWKQEQEKLNALRYSLSEKFYNNFHRAVA